MCTPHGQKSHLCTGRYWPVGEHCSETGPDIGFGLLSDPESLPDGSSGVPTCNNGGGLQGIGGKASRRMQNLRDGVQKDFLFHHK